MSAPLIELIGQQIGSWTVLHRVENRGGNRTYYMCQCQCGNVREVSGQKLRAGKDSRCRECFYKRGKLTYRQLYLRRYGLTEGEFDAMVTAQNGECKICGSNPDGLVIDHDHMTNRIRGLLCNRCNLGIGLLNDDANTIRSALAYLEA